jgi:hypothetical protein
LKGESLKRWWKLERARRAEEREKERKAALPAKKQKRVFTPLKPRPTKWVITESMERTASLPSAIFQKRDNPQVIESQLQPEEYRVREEAAQKEIQRKKMMVAPLYNKGGYQFIGDAPPEIIETRGSKI